MGAQYGSAPLSVSYPAKSWITVKACPKVLSFNIGELQSGNENAALSYFSGRAANASSDNVLGRCHCIGDKSRLHSEPRIHNLAGDCARPRVLVFIVVPLSGLRILSKTIAKISLYHGYRIIQSQSG